MTSNYFIPKFIVAGFCMLMASPMVSAQIQKGSVFLGGDIQFANYKSSFSTAQPDEQSKNADFNIKVGKAFNDNSFWGVSLQYAPYSERNNTMLAYPNTSAHTYSAGVFFRRYKNLAKDFYFFLEADAGFTYSKQTDRDDQQNIQTTVRNSSVQIGLVPGLSYRVYKKLYLELLIPNIVSINYLHGKQDGPVSNITQNTFGFRSNLSDTESLNFVGVGFSFVL